MNVRSLLPVLCLPVVLAPPLACMAPSSVTASVGKLTMDHEQALEFGQPTRLAIDRFRALWLSAMEGSPTDRRRLVGSEAYFSSRRDLRSAQSQLTNQMLTSLRAHPQTYPRSRKELNDRLMLHALTAAMAALDLLPFIDHDPVLRELADSHSLICTQSMLCRQSDVKES